MIEYLVLLGFLVVLLIIGLTKRSMLIGLAIIVLCLALIFKTDDTTWTYKEWLEVAYGLISCVGVLGIYRSIGKEGGDF